MGIEGAKRDLVELMHDAAKKTGGFFCSCCGKAQKENQLAYIKAYKARDGEPAPYEDGSTKKAAAFAVCSTCKASYPEDRIRLSVLKTLAKNKLFEA